MMRRSQLGQCRMRSPAFPALYSAYLPWGKAFDVGLLESMLLSQVSNGLAVPAIEGITDLSCF